MDSMARVSRTLPRSQVQSSIKLSVCTDVPGKLTDAGISDVHGWFPFVVVAQLIRAPTQRDRGKATTNATGERCGFPPHPPLSRHRSFGRQLLRHCRLDERHDVLGHSPESQCPLAGYRLRERANVGQHPAPAPRTIIPIETLQRRETSA